MRINAYKKSSADRIIIRSASEIFYPCRSVFSKQNRSETLDSRFFVQKCRTTRPIKSGATFRTCPCIYMRVYITFSWKFGNENSLPRVKSLFLLRPREPWRTRVYDFNINIVRRSARQPSARKTLFFDDKFLSGITSYNLDRRTNSQISFRQCASAA